MKGRYIVIEGLDGSGKSTQHVLLCKTVSNSLAIREPGFTPAVEAIRNIVKDASINRSPRTNGYLFSAARADLIDTIIRPSVNNGFHVISDRNWLSTAAYQQVEGASMPDILHLARLATQEFFTPDLVIFIDVSAEVCRKRLHTRGEATKDYFDSKGLNYFTNVRHAYFSALQGIESHVVIDGNQSVGSVHTAILQHVKACLPQIF